MGAEKIQDTVPVSNASYDVDHVDDNEKVKETLRKQGVFLDNIKPSDRSGDADLPEYDPSKPTIPNPIAPRPNPWLFNPSGEVQGFLLELMLAMKKLNESSVEKQVAEIKSYKEKTEELVQKIKDKASEERNQQIATAVSAGASVLGSALQFGMSRSGQKSAAAERQKAVDKGHKTQEFTHIPDGTRPYNAAEIRAGTNVHQVTSDAPRRNVDPTIRVPDLAAAAPAHGQPQPTREIENPNLNQNRLFNRKIDTIQHIEATANRIESGATSRAQVWGQMLTGAGDLSGKGAGADFIKKAGDLKGEETQKTMEQQMIRQVMDGWIKQKTELSEVYKQLDESIRAANSANIQAANTASR